MRKAQTMLLPFMAIALLAVTGCQRHSHDETYYLISNNLKLTYWQTAVEGFNKAAAEYHVQAKVVGPDTYDPQAELTELQHAIAAKPAGILISVADATLFQSEINAGIDAGIPIITMDSDAPHSHRLFFIGTNNLQAGRLGGQRVVNKLPNGKGNVVFFSMPGQPNLDDRFKGYQEVFADHPGIKTVEVVDIKGQSTAAFDRAQQFMTQTGDKKIDAFICLEASAGKEVAAVLKNDNSNRLLVAMDVDPDTLNLIKSGVIDATIAQKPYTMGYIGLKALDQVFHDGLKTFSSDYSVDTFSPFPVFIDTGTAVVDKVNVDLFSNSAAAAQK
ncbi:substrate-binding domain-containing protein [Alloacidobacterium dinghuense]|uniref:Substrate-binding domain-containing protein n=1 Tax=Alloacidobacterium dinghuense TaxID=2763107 RepID=A0A7G8BF86_9BACT|nr:substrate-binding domain-containing protein [Alloacidobacterium dinghuense]QNI31206.1 substrate-binding domain-containing protein [Alloacidobacterium dinghuense]